MAELVTRGARDLIQDARYGWRALRRSPVFTTVALLTLALGIGANTAIFSLIDVLMLRDLPVRDPARLVQFTWTYPGDPPLNLFSVADYEHYRDHNSVFSDMLGTASGHVEPQTAGRSPELRHGPAAPGTEALGVECVTGNFFNALGVRSAAGRLLGDQDNRPASPPVAVVSWTYWTERLHGRPDVLGTSMMVAGMPVTIVGVADQRFFGLTVGYRPDVWVPVSVCRLKDRPGLAIMARL